MSITLQVWSKKKRETLFGIHPVEICLSERKRTIYKVLLMPSNYNTFFNSNEICMSIYRMFDTGWSKTDLAYFSRASE